MWISPYSSSLSPFVVRSTFGGSLESLILVMDAILALRVVVVSQLMRAGDDEEII